MKNFIVEILDCYPRNPPIPLVSLKVKQLNCIMMSYNKKNTPLKKYSCQKKIRPESYKANNFSYKLTENKTKNILKKTTKMQ